MVAQLRKMSMPVELNMGVVELTSEFTVCKSGEPLTVDQARILVRLLFCVVERPAAHKHAMLLPARVRWVLSPPTHPPLSHTTVVCLCVHAGSCCCLLTPSSWFV